MRNFCGKVVLSSLNHASQRTVPLGEKLLLKERYVNEQADIPLFWGYLKIALLTSYFLNSFCWT
jgi:hypothetical protein